MENQIKFLISYFFAVPQKVLMKAFKTFIKPFDAPQKSMKIKT